MELNEILAVAARRGASDVHMKAGQPPMVRLNGTLLPFKDAPRLAPDQLARMAAGIMTPYQRERFKQSHELDLSHSVQGIGRFRVNVFQQRGAIGMVMRTIPTTIQTIDELGLPTVLKKIALEPRGLVIVVGTTGSGKSTTLAALVEHINQTRPGHIMTVEDPIEFVFRDKRCLVNQREIGVDTLSFADALRSALRQDPDVILVGEMRDLETIETAMTAAETGHLVLSTVHTMDAAETINRVLAAFPPHQQRQVRLQLGAVLRAVIGQRLVPTADGKGRVAALDVLRVTPRVRELIEDEGRIREIPDAIAEGGTSYGMQSFDQSLMMHLKAKRITYEEALRQSTNPSNFALRVRGIESTSDSSWENFDAGGA
jgi:twitching motility protein PilT